MATHDLPKTSPLLLRQLRDWRDQQAWLQFLRSYGPGIRATSRQAGLGQDDAEEVAQRVFWKLALRMRDFVYDPGRTFRAWLRQMIRHEAIDYFRQNRRKSVVPGSGDSAVMRFMEQQPGPNDAEELDVSGQQQLFQELAIEVQAAVLARVSPDSWQAFWLTELEGFSTKEAAKQLGKTFAATYMAAQRVRRQLRKEGEKRLEEYRKR